MQLRIKLYKILFPVYEKPVVQKSEPSMFTTTKLRLIGSKNSSVERQEGKLHDRDGTGSRLCKKEALDRQTYKGTETGDIAFNGTGTKQN